MAKDRNAAGTGDERPLTARSVLASTLLGLDPPALPAHRLVATAGLFGISEGTARTALSRMAAAGEVEAEDGAYRLAGHLLERAVRQDRSRAARTRRWRGRWRLAVVVAEARDAPARAALRAAMGRLRLAEWREGVWARPDNLGPEVLPEAVAGQCRWLTARLDDADDAALAVSLWDLGAWAARAEALRQRLAASLGGLAAGDTATLAPGFVLSAAVLRHLQADPLLPAELLPPAWPGPALRADYDAWDAAYRAVLAEWHRGAGTTVRPPAPPERKPPGP